MQRWRRVPKMPGHRFSPRRQLLCSLLIGLLMGCSVVVWINHQLRPMIVALSESHFSNQIALMIGRELSQEIQDGMSYSDLVELHYDDSGRLTAVTTNLKTGNQLESQIVSCLISELKSLENETVSVPVGSLSGLTVLSGQGFGIPVRLVGVTNIEGSMDSTLTAVGINQSLHRLDLVITADLTLILPGGPCTHTVTNRVALAETVLLGQVPENYTYFSQFDSAQDAAGAYFDYGAGEH